jgi:hypothetical protein
MSSATPVPQAQSCMDPLRDSASGQETGVALNLSAMVKESRGIGTGAWWGGATSVCPLIAILTSIVPLRTPMGVGR